MKKATKLDAATLSIPGRAVDGTLAAFAEALHGRGDLSVLHGAEGVAVKAEVAIVRAYSADKLVAVINFGGRWMPIADIPESAIREMLVRVPLHPSEIAKRQEIEEQRRRESEALNPRPGSAIAWAKAAALDQVRRIAWRRSHGY